jgi:Tol biopolymer transport system component
MAGGSWTTPQQLASVSTANYEKWFAVCDGGYYMVSRNSGAGTAYHLYEGQLGAGADVLAAELAGATGNDISTFLTTDCMTTYFASSRSGTTQLYTATRSTPTATWSAPALVTDFGAAGDNEDPWMSSDQRVFYFASERYPATNTNKCIYCSAR